MANLCEVNRFVKINDLIDGRWLVGKFIRTGTFRSYYFEVTDTRRPIHLFTIKVESNAPPTPNEPPRFLVLERNLLSAIKCEKGRYYVGLESFGETETFHYIITYSVGLNIEEIRARQRNGRFTLRTCLHVARRSLFCIEELHNAGYIHRDIKPANYCIGNGPDDLRQMYLSNFEMCRRYIDDNGKICPPRKRAPYRGSPRYSSVSALQEKEQGPVDDMWAWFYTLIDLVIGKLPWDETEGRETAILAEYIARLAPEKQKSCLNGDYLLLGCPREFFGILKHLNSLNFEDKPDYALYLRIINTIMQRKEYTPNIPLDWEPKAPSVHRRSVRSQRTT